MPFVTSRSLSPRLLSPRILLVLLVAGFLAVASGQAGLKIYYLRHAESGANVAKAWENKPAADRPAYVGNAGAFSPRGEKQAAAVPAKLAPYSFDFIAVSPLWRTRHTILPYLQATGRHAEIWPELAEFGRKDGDQTLIATPRLPAPRPDLLRGGRRVVLPEKEKNWFTLRDDNLTEPHLGRSGAEGAADLTALIESAIARVKAQADTGEKPASILLVGHGTAGKYFLWRLTGDRRAVERGLANTGLWMAEQQPDGRFKLMLADGRPLAPAP